MSVGPFFKIQSNPIQQITDPIQSTIIVSISTHIQSNQSTVHSVGENTIEYVSEFDSFLQFMLHVDS